MMKTAKVADNVYTRNVVIVVLGMGYSVFALYASGKDAVMGGMLVLGIVYIVWGFIANRFTGQLEGSPRARGEGMRRKIMRIKSSAMFAFAAVALACAMPAAAQTLDRITRDGLHQARLPRRRKAILVRGFGGQARRLHDRVCAARSSKSSRRIWPCRS